MKNRRLSLAVAVVVAAIVAVVIVWNLPLTYRVGVDGEVYTRKIPLYAKACGFLYRDWRYKDIVHDILLLGNKTDEEKALAILRWTSVNVKLGVPAGLKTVDDHPLNIIIRGYGTTDQLDDIFTILCSYAGLRAGMEKCYNADKTKHVILSFVRTGKNRWLIFDASKNKYFLNARGGIASVDDYLSGNLLLFGDEVKDYGPFLKYVKEIDFSSFTRAGEQMPLKRIPIEMGKMMKKAK